MVIVLEGDQTWETMPPQGIFDIVSGEFQEIQRDYPDIDYLADSDYMWPTSTIFDPTLTRVVFTAYSQDGIKLLLWDVNTGQEIAKLFPWEYTIEPAKWSPDGSRFVTAHAVIEQGVSTWHQEIFSVSYDGEIEQLTYFNDMYESPRIGTMSWSPDSQYVAFWFMDYLNDDYETLAVLDIETQEVVNYCIPGNQFQSITAAPIWSPSSQQLLVKNTLENGNQSRVILVDISQGFAAQIAENMEPVGWLKKAP